MNILQFPILLLAIATVSYASPLQQEILSLLPSDYLSNVRKELVRAEIIPTVIDSFTPKYSLSITWPTNKSASLGNALTTKDVADVPTVSLIKDSSSSSSSGPVSSVLDMLLSFKKPSSKPDPTYALAMTDPDAPSRDDPKWSEFCHWIVTNVPLTPRCTCIDRFSGDHHPHSPAVLSASEVVSYRPPTPPEKTGYHRYVFLAFEPKNGTSKGLHLSTPNDRKRWGTGRERHGVRDWAKENGLVPVAANFVYVQNEKQS